MQKPTSRERRRLQRLRKPVFAVRIDEAGVVRQLENQESATERPR